MSAPEGSVAREPARRLAQFGTIVVVGGGCYGSYYVRQLRRAREAGAVSWRRLLVVDRDAACRVSREGETTAPAGGGAEVVVSEWGPFFAGYLGEAAAHPAAVEQDAIVPSPLMPHLLFEWVADRARSRWPARAVGTVPLARPPNVPWERAAPDGTHYVSFAEWMCPVNCVEPALCPYIRGPRSWSLPPAVRAYVAAEGARGRPLAGPLLFHCTHRAYGVGMIDTRDVLAADAHVAERGTDAELRVLVGTVSHCHGALSVLRIGGAEGSPERGSAARADSRN